MDKIKMVTDDGSEIELYVVEQTRVSGTDYILVTDSEDDEATAYILKDISEEGSADAVYEFVDDDGELESVGRLFSEMLEDTDIV